MDTEFDPKVDYYAILGIDDRATAADIKKAHRARIAEIHPDRGGEAARAAAVNVARDILSKPSTRRTFDQARRRWFLEALESPVLRAWFDPDGKLAAHFAAQAGAAQASTRGRTGAAPQSGAAGASAPGSASSPRETSAPQGAASEPRRRPAAGFSRLYERFAAERTRAASQGSTEGPFADANAASSPPEPAERRWKWGALTESVWADALKILESGDWLGAAGMFGTALFLDRTIYAKADPATRAKADAVVAAGKQERAMAFIELIAGAVGAHFGLDCAEVEARAGAAARKAASSTARKAAARRPGKPKRKVRRIRRAADR